MGKQNEFESTNPDEDLNAAPNVITVDKDDDADTDFGGDPSDVQDPNQKQETIPVPVKDAVMKALREAIERLMTIAQAIRGSESAEAKRDKPLPVAVGKELLAVGALMDSVTASFPAPVTKGEEGECPPGFVWSEDHSRCVREQKAEGMSEAEKAKAEKMLTSVIEDLDAVRKSVQDAPVNDGSAEGSISEVVAQRLRAAANALGAVVGNFPSMTQKGFAVVDLEVEPTAFMKAIHGMTLHPEQARDLTEKVEKAIDDMAELLGEIDVMKERAHDESDTTPMPTKVADPFNIAKADVLDIVDNYVAKDENKRPCCDKGGDGEGEGDEKPAESGDGDGGDDKPAEGEGSQESTEKGDDEEKVESEGQSKCPAGTVWDGDAKRCVPANPDTDDTEPKKSETKPEEKPSETAKGDDIAAIIGKAIGDAIAPLNERIDKVIVDQHEQGKKLAKMAGEPTGSNVSQPGSREATEKRDKPNNWKNQLGRDPKEIEALEKEDLIF